MFVIRETFTAKPGKASALATMFKQVMGEMTTLTTRVMTDYIAGFNTVVLETEVQNLGEFEKELETYMSRQDLRDKMKGYTEMYQDGRREVYKLV